MPHVRRVLALYAVSVLAVALASVGVASATGGSGHATDRTRGLVLAGLTRATHGPCAGDFTVVVPGAATTSCSHGPDAAPTGVDVTLPRETAALTTTSSTGATVQCIDDGVSGPRVQAVYAVASDVPDRYATVAPLIAGWAGQVDADVSHSAAETGGDRHVRFVTNPDCSLNVAHVVLSPTGDDNLSNTISDLQKQGYNLSTRKYLVWTDALVYCGIAQVTTSDSSSSSNPANSGPNYARVDSNCWGLSSPVELHELFHTLGSVQLSVPHSSGAYHCTDDYDRMCYADGPGVTMTYLCPSTHEALLDCNHDDYFSTSPPAGSYLASHWNSANSVFLAGAPASSPPPPTSTGTSSATFSGSVSAKHSSKSYAMAVGAGDASSLLMFTSHTKGALLSLRVLDAGGTCCWTRRGRAGWRPR